MTVTRPNEQQVIAIANRLGMNLTKAQASAYLAIMEGSFKNYDLVDAAPDNVPVSKYPRTPGYRPPASENKYGAWYHKTDIKGADSGKLAGKTVALKDNVSLAGVPMMNGASTLEGYVPAFDATIVTRMLDAGATIKGKAVCEYFCLCGGSHTPSSGYVHNPRKRGYSAGGSSSGSGALVAAGEVDMAIGGDQGGSIRIPSSYCGIYGMKPTHGLVPYTGVMPIESTIDHTGPMTANVRDNALLLEVLAGPDGLDPRQYSPKVSNYTEALKKGASGLRIGVLKEGFGLSNMEPEVKEKVRQAAQRFAKMGAKLEEISISEHSMAGAVWDPIAIEGLQWQMMIGNGMGMNWKGLYNVGLMDKHAGWRHRADELPHTVKICMLLGQYFIDQYNGRFYGKAQNLRRLVKAAYDEKFKNFDLLLMPTLPNRATKLPEPEVSIADYWILALGMLGNTAPFDVTGHPAMSLPCGMVDGLPIGLMLVGPDYGESAIYQAAAAFESEGDWKMF